ncbi:MAG TPA: hypothetical protein PLX59_02295 [Candidatus Cloacimonadota bacterium]|nr:hypothetical protein [Candidatus Cloacimonadota bacterium]
MITLKDYLAAIGGHNLTPGIDPEKIQIKGAYVSDMLSDVMGNGKAELIWITIMKHLNVIAVASMTSIPAVLFAKGVVPEASVIEKALEEDVCLITSPLSTFDLAGILYKMLGL